MSPDTILRSDAIEQIYQAYGRPSDDEVFIRMREALERVPWVSPLTFETNSKEYKMPDGRTAVFEYSDDGIGRITLENMDMLMGMLADRPQGEWIPCSERLPSEQGQYLVTFPLCNEEPWVYILSFNKGKFYETDDEWGDVEYDDVTAWMPLPKPWKGADDE